MTSTLMYNDDNNDFSEGLEDLFSTSLERMATHFNLFKPSGSTKNNH